MDNVLYLVFENAQCFQPETLYSTVTVSKFFKDITYSTGWKKVYFQKENYDTSTCSKCHLNKYKITSFGICTKCINTYQFITATDAKKEWKLNDDDLEELNVYEKWHNTYRKTIRLFLRKDVKLYAIIKYGGPASYLNFIRKSHGISKSKQKRIDSLTVVAKDIDKHSTKFQLCCSDYLANGSGGIKSVKQKLSRWDDFEKIMLKFTDEDIELLKTYNELSFLQTGFVNGFVVNIEEEIQHKITIIKNKIQRKNNLITKLNACGLQFRHDSKICRQYLDGARDDLDTIIEIMQEMNFFFSQTKYQSILNRHIQQMKDDIRIEYGWLPQDEYQDIFEYGLQTTILQAKKEAIKSWSISKLPSYMLKYR